MPRINRAKQNEYQRSWYAKNKEAAKEKVKANKHKYRNQWREFKATLSCINCGFNHPAALDFHHVIRSPDNRKVNELLRKNAYRAAMEEVKRCVVLCANCHRVHHHEERQQSLAKKNKKSSRRKG